jgi:DNA-binding transcriptional LysR family regulator
MTTVELRHLRYFAAVAEELHFGRAAARLYVTQSNLSVQIRQLEAEVGGALFVRTSRAVELTESGRLLYAEAKRALHQAERALHVARQSVLGEAGSIRIGFSGVAVFSGILPADLRAFHDTHRHVDVELHELPPAAVVSELHGGAIDLGYTPDLNPALSAGLAQVRRTRVGLAAALRDDHPLAARGSITRAALIDEILILPGAHSGDATLADRFRSPTDAANARIRLVGSTLGVLALAAAGTGVAVVPADTDRLSVSGLVYLPIVDVDGPEMVVLTRPGETLGTVCAFLGQLREVTGQSGRQRR